MIASIKKYSLVCLFLFLLPALLLCAWRLSGGSDSHYFYVSLAGAVFALILFAVVLQQAVSVISSLFARRDKLRLASERRVEHYQQRLDKQKRLTAIYKERLAELKEEVAASQTAHDRHVIELSHELRAPLTELLSGTESLEKAAIQGSMSMFNLGYELNNDKGGELAQSMKGLLRKVIDTHDSIIRPSINSLESTVRQMVDGIDGETLHREIKLIEQPFNVHEELVAALRPLQEKASVKNLRFAYSGLEPEMIGLCVVGDAFRIRQVVTCLVENALRFTSAGGVSVSIDALTRPSSNLCNLAILVSDSGCGMNHKQQQEIAALLHGSNTPPDAGWEADSTGKLSVVSAIAAQMGAKLSLQHSEPGCGTTFVFSLTLKKESLGAGAVSQMPAPAAKARLLYIDDSKVCRTSFRRNCEAVDVDLELACNGFEGWDKYHSGNFDSLIIDLLMPECDGFELVQRIREHEYSNQLPRIPIFALTATPTESNRRKAMEAGFDDFLTKPYNRQLVNYVVDRTAGLQAERVANSFVSFCEDKVS